MNEYCYYGVECRNETSQETGACLYTECDPAYEYEIFNSEKCNGTQCHCCAKKRKDVLSIIIQYHRSAKCINTRLIKILNKLKRRLSKRKPQNIQKDKINQCF